MLDLILDGLGLGAVYAFIALGYTMVYGIIGLINFAHGEFFMFGGFVGFFVLRDLNIDRIGMPQPIPILLAILVALLAAAIAAAVLAVLTERIAYRPVRGAGRIAALLTAVGVSFFLQNLAIKVWKAEPRAYVEPAIWTSVDKLEGTAEHDWRAPDDPRVLIPEGTVVTPAVRSEISSQGIKSVRRSLGLTKQAKQGIVVLFLLFCTPVLWFLVKRTRTGKAMRAVSEDQDAALLMGININRTVAATFFIGAFIAGIGGVLYCMAYGSVEPMTGWLPGLKAFIAAVIGGIGSIPGAIIGGLLLGLAEVVIPEGLEQMGWDKAQAFKEVVAYLFLIVVLLFKPTGLLGRPLREKV